MKDKIREILLAIALLGIGTVSFFFFNWQKTLAHSPDTPFWSYEYLAPMLIGLVVVGLYILASHDKDREE